jgi:hypothetical protein
MKCRKTLILIGVFFATIPISYLINAFVPLSLGIFHIFRILLGSTDLLLIIHAAYWLTIILTSLFFTFIAWLFLKARDESATKGTK